MKNKTNLKNITLEEKLEYIAAAFNLIDFQLYANGCLMKIGISRPSNAPKYKYTNADMARAKLCAEVNLAIIKYAQEKPRSLSELADFVINIIRDKKLV